MAGAFVPLDAMGTAPKEPAHLCRIHGPHQSISSQPEINEGTLPRRNSSHRAVPGFAEKLRGYNPDIGSGPQQTRFRASPSAGRRNVLQSNVQPQGIGNEIYLTPHPGPATLLSGSSSPVRASRRTPAGRRSAQHSCVPGTGGRGAERLWIRSGFGWNRNRGPGSVPVFNAVEWPAWWEMAYTPPARHNVKMLNPLK